MTGSIRRLLRRPLHREPGSWSVCAMVAEPPELLCAFAAHYLEQGAEEVHLFIDDPKQPGLELLRGMEGVRLTLCTERYWKYLVGHRPDWQVMRQLANANRAYADCRTEWFFFCDADEFFVSSVPVSELLQAVPEDVMHCRTPMAERVFRAETAQAHLFDGVFRIPLPRRPGVLRAVYGDLADMTTRGLSGHVWGKSFVRAGRDDLRIRLHFPVPKDKEEEARLRDAGQLKPGPKLAGGWLVHFDGITPLHWVLKLLRFYLDNAPKLAAGDKTVFARRTPARSQQLTAVFEAAGDPLALRRLRALVELDAASRAQLDQAGGLLHSVVDPRQAAWRRASRDLDFDPVAFDARLRARFGDLIETYGLES